jgi:hypothetical protein
MKLPRPKAKLEVETSGLADLPEMVAVVIEENAAKAAKPVHPSVPDSVENLVSRLQGIRERLFWLQAVWATTLSPDIAWEADRYRQLFRDLGDQLRKQDATALDRIVAGHEALLLAEPMRPKRSIPLETQRWAELRWAASQGRVRQTPSRPADTIHDGLGEFL